MKKFSAFLKEAQKSFAAQEAEKLNLKHVGYGKYADQTGKVTHMSQDGKLRKLTAQELAGGTTNGGEETAGGGVRSIKVAYLLLLEDLIPLLLDMKHF